MCQRPRFYDEIRFPKLAPVLRKLLPWDVHSTLDTLMKQLDNLLKLKTIEQLVTIAKLLEKEVFGPYAVNLKD